MNFLELVQRLHTETGASSTAPTAVTGQTGRAARLVNWILTADETIQNEHVDWGFLKTEFSFSTVDGTQTYTKAAISLTELAAWYQYGMHIYLSSYSDESEITFIQWEDFRSAYMHGSFRSHEERPYIASANPSNSLVLWPIPDGVYTVTGEYFKRPQAMSADDSESVIPSQYHMAIVWRALMLYGAYEGANEVYQHGQNEFKKAMRKLELNQLPKMQLGPPLA